MLASLVTASALSLAAAAGPPPSEEAVVTYLTAITTSDPAPALALSAPRSAAYGYAVHQSAVQEAIVAAGESQPEFEVTADGDDAQLCQIDPLSGESQCSNFAGFVTDAAELITTFTVDGTTIDGRVGDPSEPVAAGPVTATTRSSYRSDSNDALFVTVGVQTTADVELNGGYGATYIGADGAQVEVADARGPNTLFASANTTVLLIFPGMDPGGRVVWELFSADFSEQFRLDLPVPILGAGAPPATTTITSA